MADERTFDFSTNDVCGILLQYPATDGSVIDYKPVVAKAHAAGRGLHSLYSQLNLSAFYGIGGARRGCVGRVKGVIRVCRVFIVCHTRLKLS